MSEVILYHILGAAIALHDVLNGFQYGHRTETASLEVKLIQHLIEMGEEVI